MIIFTINLHFLKKNLIIFNPYSIKDMIKNHNQNIYFLKDKCLKFIRKTSASITSLKQNKR